jgi:hypothetical protein
MSTNPAISPVETNPEADYLQKPDPLPTTEYSENLILMGYDPGSGYSFYWHWSRMHRDPDLWEGLITVYLPGGELLMERHLGAHGNNRDVASSGYTSFTVEEPLKRWHARFDGLVNRTSTLKAARMQVSDTGLTHLSADLVFEGITPVFSAGAGMDQQDWGDGHLEQAGTVTGTITVEGETVNIDCTAMRDHTWGRREYSTLDGHAWCFGIFPSGRTFLVLNAFTSEVNAQFGFVVQGDEMVPAKPLQTPPLDDPTGAPREFTIELTSSLGDMTIDCEMLHAAAFHLKAPLEMPLGTDWDDDANTINVEGPIKVRWNGEEAYGWIERTNRAGKMTRPEA